jgi:hypothetical protein
MDETYWRVTGRSYSYAQVEAALGTLFDVPASARGSFRGRVRHLQRVGLVEVAPGKGRRISYTRIQATEWMLALLLAELGVDPVVIVKSIQRDRNQLREWIAEAPDEAALGGNEVFLATQPKLMSGAWASKHAVGILQFAKFRRHDSALKMALRSPPPPSDPQTSKPTMPSLLAPPSPELTQPARPTHALDPKDLATGPADLGTPELRELRFLDWAAPLLLVINLTQSVRALGAALESAPSD